MYVSLVELMVAAICENSLIMCFSCYLQSINLYVILVLICFKKFMTQIFKILFLYRLYDLIIFLEHDTPLECGLL
jgi:hypothetical protein